MLPCPPLPPKKHALRVNGARVGAATRPLTDGAATGYARVADGSGIGYRVPGMRVVAEAPTERYAWEPEE
ncbi:MAG: hypothetical protein ABI867_09575 [Kofleriaceae bacterium]